MTPPEQKNPKRDIVVIGGSSGALQALQFIGELPSGFPAAVFLVVHIAPSGPGLLPNIVRAYSSIPVEHAYDGETIEPGRIYVARPDYHMSLRQDVVEVARGPKENRHRPSIDVLFRSAATSYGPRVVGVILSGMLDDGSSGLAEIRTRGGIGIVQDPNDALFPDMPLNALAQAGADYQAPRSRLAAVLSKALMDPINNYLLGEVRTVRTVRGKGEASQVSMKRNHDQESRAPSNFSCPDCGGVLRQLEDNKMLLFRCRVGHALSSSSLLAAQSDNVEQALWSALRAIEEKAEMARKLKDYALARNFRSTPNKFDDEAKKLESDANVIRELLKHAEGSEVA